MPIYVCIHGDVQEVGLTEPGVFTVEDSKGRRWYCREGTESDINEAFVVAVPAMTAQPKAIKQGLSNQGTKLIVTRCDRVQLFDKLSDK